MAQVIDVIAYICLHFPYPKELSRSRLSKMVYLADWRSCIVYEKQITNLVWISNYFGPYAEKLVDHVRVEGLFRITVICDQNDRLNEFVQLINQNYCPRLTIEERSVIDHVILNTKNLNIKDFTRLVCSTYPVIFQQKLQELDLVTLAKDYKNVSYLLT